MSDPNWLEQIQRAPSHEVEILGRNVVYGYDSGVNDLWLELCCQLKEAQHTETRARSRAASPHGRIVPLGSPESAQIDDSIKARKDVELRMAEFRRTHNMPPRSP